MLTLAAWFFTITLYGGGMNGNQQETWDVVMPTQEQCEILRKTIAALPADESLDGSHPVPTARCFEEGQEMKAKKQ